MENWHLSRNVPIALFVGLLVQTVSVSGAFTRVEVGVEQNTKNIEAVDERVNKLDARQREHEVTIARMDENIIHIRELLDSKE